MAGRPAIVTVPLRHAAVERPSRRRGPPRRTRPGTGSTHSARPLKMDRLASVVRIGAIRALATIRPLRPPPSQRIRLAGGVECSGPPSCVDRWSTVDTQAALGSPVPVRMRMTGWRQMFRRPAAIAPRGPRAAADAATVQASGLSDPLRLQPRAQPVGVTEDHTPIRCRDTYLARSGRGG